MRVKDSTVKTATTLDLISGLLSNHSPADDREADSLTRIKELVKTASAPFSRDHFVPGHLTASAIVVDPIQSKTLLIFHGKLHRWLQPGGHFEPGENDPSVAATREVFEETGLATEAFIADTLHGSTWLLDVDVHSIPARKTEPEHCHFDLRMLRVATGIPKAAEVADARWFGAEECANLALDPGLVRALKKTRFWPTYRTIAI
jgi:8-oxo-dGTP pyrophosphatase MutT (NUDIX family)